ncbi:hypothetical protein [Crossiella cryophila]|uniref:Uncharacterized protein n=1 Tax=Crossiella cryophila TaxID=43355 RepID=A0A7W7FSN3_9PSEU|nr:hypothetical protein [Crossiella cryophila]MBB4677226.1 hypothetical protein [Crossiella cryophila]
MNDALRPGKALHTAVRIGLVEAGPQPAISRTWRPVWWALREFGWLDETLLGCLDRLPDAFSPVPCRRLVRRLREIDWLVRDRAPGRPARLFRITPRGAAAISGISGEAPLWTASSREVARRAVARALPIRGQHEVSSVCRSVSEVAAVWSRLVRDGDVRMVLRDWRRTGWIADVAELPGRWVLTELGHRCGRAIGIATATAHPRRPRQQDLEHDRLLIEGIRRLLVARPGLVGPLRVARRCRLGDLGGPRWILPDALVGFQAADRRFLLAIEAERRGRYEALARHLRRYRQLAELLPADTVHVAVLCTRRSPGRLNALTDALAESGSPAVFRAAMTTPSTLVRQLVTWGIDGHAEPIPPPW